jgi:hypothetical protein
MAAVPLAVYKHLALGSMWHIGYEGVTGGFPGYQQRVVWDSDPQYGGHF